VEQQWSVLNVGKTIDGNIYYNTRGAETNAVQQPAQQMKFSDDGAL
jgi:hypothetical protein